MSAAIIYLAIIFSHQILGDIHYPYGVSNAVEVQRVIESYSDVVPVAFTGTCMIMLSRDKTV